MRKFYPEPLRQCKCDMTLAARGKSRARAKNGDCHQFAPRHGPRNKALTLKRIGWLYPIFRDLHFYHGLLGVTGLSTRRLALNRVAPPSNDNKKALRIDFDSQGLVNLDRSRRRQQRRRQQRHRTAGAAQPALEVYSQVEHDVPRGRRTRVRTKR